MIWEKIFVTSWANYQIIYIMIAEATKDRSKEAKIKQSHYQIMVDMPYGRHATAKAEEQA